MVFQILKIWDRNLNYNFLRNAVGMYKYVLYEFELSVEQKNNINDLEFFEKFMHVMTKTHI